MSKVHELQKRAATLPENMAAEVLDFLEFVTIRRTRETAQSATAITRLLGAFKGRLSSSDEFASRKSDEIRLEE